MATNDGNKRGASGASAGAQRPGLSCGLHDQVPHFPQSSLRWSRDDGWMPESQVLLSRAEHASVAVVFVHGWGGSASSTWEQFPERVAQMQGASELDAYFLDYPSTKRKVAFCADKLRHFLTDVASQPAVTMINDSLPERAGKRRVDARYERIVLVAHSMGAVIARRALLDLEMSQQDLCRFSLLFFAPAHCGSNLALLVGSGLGLDFLPGAKLVGEAARVFLPSMRDLEPGGATLVQLSDDTRRRQDSRDGPAEFLKARVYHAENDKVVEQLRFVGDYPTEPVMRCNHRSICKPDRRYDVPAVALEALLRSVVSTPAGESRS